MPEKNYDDKIGFESARSFKQANREKAGSGCVFSDFADRLADLGNTASKHQIEELRAILHKAHKRRFRRRTEPKYGSTSRAFTELELQHFLRNAPNDKFRLLFSYQACLGLRVGEVCKLRVGNNGNIDFDKRELTITSEKSGKLDSLRIPPNLFKETVDFINQNMSAIRAAQGHIFFKENDNNHNEVPYIDLNYVRKVFRDTAKKAGFNQIYGYSEETEQIHRERPLYRLTTHSLRHYAITKFAKATNGNVVLTSRFARHSNPIITMRYIARNKDELYDEIDNAFSNDKIKAIRRLSEQVSSSGHATYR